MATRYEDMLHDRELERQQILDALEQGIMDRMDYETNASHWAEGAYDALLQAGFTVARKE